MSYAVTRPIGASSDQNASSWIVATTSAPKPEVRGASCTTIARPQAATASRSPSASSGTSVWRSSTPTE